MEFQLPDRLDPEQLDELEMAYGEDEGRFWILNFGGSKGNVDETSRLVLLAKDTLEELDFGPSNLTDRGLQNIARLPRLRTLDVHKTKITGRGLNVLLTLPKLEELTCSIQEHTADGLSYIGRLTKLKKLSLMESGVTDADLPALSHLSELEELDLKKTRVCRGLSVIEQMPKLRILYLDGTKINETALESIGRCRTLEELWLGEVENLNEALRHLRGLEKLRLLSFDGETTAQGLRHLAVLPELRELSWFDVRLNQESVLVLCEMQRLERIYMDQESIAGDDLALLRKRLPKCKIVVLTDDN